MGTCTLAEAAAVLRHGGAAIFPTETVYGLGLAVSASEGPQRLYDLKRRERHKPISWLVAHVDDLDRYGRSVPSFARVLARTFWPGPLTLIVRASDAVPEAFRSGEGTIGLRMPANAKALALIERVGCPLATTSANLSGERAPRTAAAVSPALASQVDALLVDDDDLEKSGVASTVLDCTGDHPVMVREGAITVADIQALS